MNLTSSCRPFQVLQFHIAPSSCQCMLAIARLLTRPEALSNSNCWSLVGQQLWQGDFLRLKDSRRQMPYMWLSSLKIVSISYKAECHMYSWCKIEYIIELHIQYFHGKSDTEWLGVTWCDLEWPGRAHVKLMRSLRKLACWQSYALSQLRRCQPPLHEPREVLLHAACW